MQASLTARNCHLIVGGRLLTCSIEGGDCSHRPRYVLGSHKVLKVR